MKTIKEIIKFIDESVRGLKNDEATNYRLKLDDKLAIFVGWSAGYGDEKDDSIIQSEEDYDYGVNVGIKVWTSDDMWSDFDILNFPYYSDGEVLDMSISLSPDYNAKEIANDLVKWYEQVKDLDMTEDGLIIEDEEEFEDEDEFFKDAEEYNDDHAKEWMKKHPHGWYNNENDYGTGEEEVEEAVKSKEADKKSCNKDLKETFAGEDVIDDLVDRAQSLYDEGDYGDKEECVQQAIDDGLIYTKDIYTLLEHYGTIDSSTMIESFYDDLFNDIYSKLEDKEEEEDEDEED